MATACMADVQLEGREEGEGDTADNNKKGEGHRCDV